MKSTACIIFLFCSVFGLLSLNAQAYSFKGELSIGQSLPSNKEFPDRTLQSQIWWHVSNEKNNPDIQWHQRLAYTETGISLGYTDFGNPKILGSSFSILPFIKFRSFENNRFHTYLGLGASYFTTQYNTLENPLNRAISTDITWTFRSQLDYEWYQSVNWNYSTGISVVHHSNGHLRLPNNGFNSFLLSISATYKTKKEAVEDTPTALNMSRNTYLSFYKGLGVNVFSEAGHFNRTKEVYTIGLEYGKVYQGIWKLGVGAFYRFYEHYYDYINNEEFLVRDNERFSYMKGNAFSNATNLGMYVKAELLLNYIGIELAIGANIYKPAYKIDYYINEGWDFPPREFPEGWQFANLDSRYKLRHLINSRIGINYYPLGNNHFKEHNFYIGAHINANYGQADFSELRIGYLFCFKK
jgi:hypothetical protein